MGAYTRRQANFGYQISNLGILWGVLLIHMVNAGYAFYGLANSGGGEVVLCFLALCIFSLGRWMCACCGSVPDSGGGPGRAETLGFVPDVNRRDLKINCRPGKQRTVSYYYPNNSDPPYYNIGLDGAPGGDSYGDPSVDRNLDVSVLGEAVGGGSDPDVLAMAEEAKCKVFEDVEYADFDLPPPTPVYNNPYKDCGFPVPYGERRKKTRTIYGYGNDQWAADTCAENVTASDSEVLGRESRLEKARVVPSDIDVYMPEAHFYNRLDTIDDAKLAPACPAEAKKAKAGKFSACLEAETRRNKRKAQAAGNIVFRDGRGAGRTSSSVSYQVGLPEQMPEQQKIQSNKERRTLVRRARVRSFSPVPEGDARCDPLNQPPRAFVPEPLTKRPIRYVCSTKGIKEFMRGQCKRPNEFVDEGQRKEIERYFNGRQEDDECEDIDIVRDWPPLPCISDEESYSAASRPAADENILPVPHRGSIRNQEWVPEPGTCGKQLSSTEQPTRSMFVTLKGDGRDKKVRVNARRKGRRFHHQDRRQRPAIPVALMKMPEVNDGGDGSVNVRVRRRRKQNAELPPRFQTRGKRQGSKLAEPSKAVPILAVLAVLLAVCGLSMNPQLFEGQKEVYGRNGKAIGYLLAASSYVLFQATKDLIKAE